MSAESAAVSGVSGAASLRTLRVDSPAREEPLGEVPVLGPEEVRAAVERARVAQRAWAERSPRDRAAVLKRVRARLIERMDDVAAAVMRENGKAKAEAVMHEIGPLALQITWLAKRAPKLLEGRAPRGLMPMPRATRVRYRPRGVVGVISPWNYPFLIPFSATVEALLAGNAVVLKPSEHTPFVAVLGRRLFEEGGLPEGLLQVITGDASTGAALLEAGIDKLAFTGSVDAGRKVAARCGELLVPCTLELGGKAPLLLLPGADLERASSAAVFGGFANAGQICVGVERVYVHERHYEDVLGRLVEKTRALRQGDPEQEDVDVGAMTLPAQLAHVQALVDDAVAKGARVLTGGARLERQGRYYPPTVIADVTHEMRVAKEEVFGPLLAVLPYSDVDEAVRLCNDSHLGLNAYVFGGDRQQTHDVAARIEAGQVVVNDVLLNYVMPELPFGGVKASGVGRAHGDEGLLAMCHPQVIVDDRRTFAPGSDPWWFPYDDGKTAKIVSWLKKTVKLFDVTAR